MERNKELIEKEYEYILQYYKDDKELKLDNIYVPNKYRLCREHYKIYKALYYRTNIKNNKDKMEKIKEYSRDKWRQDHPGCIHRLKNV